ncbi:peptide deformylase [Peterkaempfera sp. SMS 1(5)a]|uniref:peptide deformylase n=1 Tax=Peterkaempfera podocarpi TaxID=3232308 RepID=UPI00366D8DAD
MNRQRAGTLKTERITAVSPSPRPLSITVEDQDIDRRRRTTIFEHGAARLVGHEIDHLEGVLCTARMRPRVDPVPVSQYRGTGRTWTYEGSWTGRCPRPGTTA